MSDTVDDKPHGDASGIEAKAAYDLDEKAHVADYRADAIAAENAEHDMTVLGAVRAYPMAAFWAFVMSFTIVAALLFTLVCSCDKDWPLTPPLDYGVLRCLPHR